MICVKCEIPKKHCNARSIEGECKIEILCKPIVDECKGKEENPSCNRVDEGYCTAYIDPEIKWKAGRECPLATHIIKETQAVRRRIGQQKQKKNR